MKNLLLFSFSLSILAPTIYGQRTTFKSLEPLISGPNAPVVGMPEPADLDVEGEEQLDEVGTLEEYEDDSYPQTLFQKLQTIGFGFLFFTGNMALEKKGAAQAEFSLQNHALLNNTEVCPYIIPPLTTYDLMPDQLLGDICHELEKPLPDLIDFE